MLFNTFPHIHLAPHLSSCQKSQLLRVLCPHAQRNVLAFVCRTVMCVATNLGRARHFWLKSRYALDVFMTGLWFLSFKVLLLSCCLVYTYLYCYSLFVTGCALRSLLFYLNSRQFTLVFQINVQLCLLNLNKWIKTF